MWSTTLKLFLSYGCQFFSNVKVINILSPMAKWAQREKETVVAWFLPINVGTFTNADT